MINLITNYCVAKSCQFTSCWLLTLFEHIEDGPIIYKIYSACITSQYIQIGKKYSFLGRYLVMYIYV